jgi:hypothetical protein
MSVYKNFAFLMAASILVIGVAATLLRVLRAGGERSARIELGQRLYATRVSLPRGTFGRNSIDLKTWGISRELMGNNIPSAPDRCPSS